MKCSIGLTSRAARPARKIIIEDEHERGARFHDQTLPGFRRSFKRGRPTVSAPVDLVPATMEAVHLASAWHGWFYHPEFRQPRQSALAG